MGQGKYGDRAGRSLRSKPGLERLETRQLLSTASVAAAHSSGLSANSKVFRYRTPSGGTAVIQMVGHGKLEGTTAPDGVLNIVYSSTNANSKIVGSVHGGNGTAPLSSLRNKFVPIDNLSGVGGSIIKTASLRQFDLIDNGRINLTSGVGIVYLNRVGSNTQIHLRESTAVVDEESQVSPTSPAAVSGIRNNYITDQFLVQTLAGSQGEFIAAGNIVNVSKPGEPGAPPAPPGIILKVNSVHGSIANPPNLLTDARIFGYDGQSNELIRFNTSTGAPDLVIQVPGAGPLVGGAALARNHGVLDVVVSDGDTVYAYNATSGRYDGSFTVANLNIPNFTSLDALGATDTTLVVGDSSAGAQNQGLLQQIDLTQSLAAGAAVPIGSAYTPQNEFTTTGGLAGVPASINVFASGAAHFNSFQPNNVQFGYLTMSTYSVASTSQGTSISNRLTETARTPVQPYTNVDLTVPDSQLRGQALGSIDQALARINGLIYNDAGQPVANRVSLFSTQTLSSRGSIQLNHSYLLTGLSESFRPDLGGSALIDVQGNVQSIRGEAATGMVINTAGNLNLLKFGSVKNSTILAEPFGHALINRRSNVSIVSSSRSVKGRGGVEVVKNLYQVGPLSFPDPY